jgi:hypothetical protein
LILSATAIRAARQENPACPVIIQARPNDTAAGNGGKMLASIISIPLTFQKPKNLVGYDAEIV